MLALHRKLNTDQEAMWQASIEELNHAKMPNSRWQTSHPGSTASNLRSQHHPRRIHQSSQRAIQERRSFDPSA